MKKNNLKHNLSKNGWVVIKNFLSKKETLKYKKLIYFFLKKNHKSFKGRDINYADNTSSFNKINSFHKLEACKHVKNFFRKGKIFKIPTFGKISKIIDFGRATFTYKKQLFFSDVFRKEGDAEGQYSYPYNNSLKDCKIKPNKSFDLSRLATTIIEHHSEESDIYRLLKLWCMDKYGNFLVDLEDDFNLYRIIAKNVKSAVPKNQINKLIFKEFIIEKEESKDYQIYNY